MEPQWAAHVLGKELSEMDDDNLNNLAWWEGAGREAGAGAGSGGVLFYYEHDIYWHLLGHVNMSLNQNSQAKGS